MPTMPKHHQAAKLSRNDRHLRGLLEKTAVQG